MLCQVHTQDITTIMSLVLLPMQIPPNLLLLYCMWLCFAKVHTCSLRITGVIFVPAVLAAHKVIATCVCLRLCQNTLVELGYIWVISCTHMWWPWKPCFWNQVTYSMFDRFVGTRGFNFRWLECRLTVSLITSLEYTREFKSMTGHQPYFYEMVLKMFGLPIYSESHWAIVTVTTCSKLARVESSAVSAPRRPSRRLSATEYWFRRNRIGEI